jgi:hypothetical protein
MAVERWQASDPRRDCPGHAVIDDDSASVIDQAVELLSLCRSPLNLGDGALGLHVLVSLINQAQALVPDAVAEALDQGYTWAEVAAQLGTTPVAARRRYRRHYRERAMPIDLD